MAELEYHQLHRATRWSWWRPVCGAVTLLIAVFAFVPVVAMVPLTIVLVVAGRSQAEINEFFLLDPVTPLSLAFILGTLAFGIHLTIAGSAVWHRLAPGWVTSVAGRLRLAWLAVCAVLAVVTMAVTLVVSAVVGMVAPVPEEQATVGTQLNDLTTTSLWFALVVLLVTPLQAAGEEYVFRGYLTQAVGGFVRVDAARWLSRGLAVLVPSLVFALAHGAQDPPVFFDRFAFGVVSGVLVIATGGLEAGIAMHVVNNWVAFGMALLFWDMTDALSPTGGTWWSLPTTLTQSLVYLGLAVGAARLMGLRTRADETEVRGGVRPPHPPQGPPDAQGPPVLAGGRPGV